MIAPAAQARQEEQQQVLLVVHNHDINHLFSSLFSIKAPPIRYGFGGVTPQNMLGTNTPQNLLASPAVGITPVGGVMQSQRSVNDPSGHAPVYAPIPSPAPPSPATPMSTTAHGTDIVPQLQNIVSTVINKHSHSAQSLSISINCETNEMVLLYSYVRLAWVVGWTLKKSPYMPGMLSTTPSGLPPSL